MFSTLRNRFGTPGVIAVIALVFAMAGGAFAAAGGLTGKQKKEVKSIAKSFQGTGPAGPVGPVGANGANGKDGTNGEKGATGPQGSIGNTGPQGSIGNTGPQGSIGNTGPQGDPWTAGGTLPVEATEAGGWAVGGAEAPESEIAEFPANLKVIRSAISFTIPLAAEPTVEVKETGFSGAPGGNCPGSAAEPKAKSGFLCVYTTQLEHAFSGLTQPFVRKLSSDGSPAAPDANTVGALVELPTAEEEPSLTAGWGTWAVTG